MGYDATTLGNHDFDLGPGGLAKPISLAAKAGQIPAVVALNTNFSKWGKELSPIKWGVSKL